MHTASAHHVLPKQFSYSMCSFASSQGALTIAQERQEEREQAVQLNLLTSQAQRMVAAQQAGARRHQSRLRISQKVGRRAHTLYDPGGA